MKLKLELEQQEIGIIVNVIQLIDPHKFFCRRLLEKIQAQCKEQYNELKKEIPQAELINEIEKEIEKEPNQPSGFTGEN